MFILACRVSVMAARSLVLEQGICGSAPEGEQHSIQDEQEVVRVGNRQKCSSGLAPSE